MVTPVAWACFIIELILQWSVGQFEIGCYAGIAATAQNFPVRKGTWKHQAEANTLSQSAALANRCLASDDQQSGSRLTRVPRPLLT
jgi:hypothetical protein